MDLTYQGCSILTPIKDMTIRYRCFAPVWYTWEEEVELAGGSVKATVGSNT